PLLQPASTPTSELYRQELLADLIFGPFNYPSAGIRELSEEIFQQIQRSEWLPHRQRLLGSALQGLESARTRDLVRRKIERWIFARPIWRHSWVRSLGEITPTEQVIDLLFDLLNDFEFDIQKTAAKFLLKIEGTSLIERLIRQFQRSMSPFQQAAILH